MSAETSTPRTAQEAGAHIAEMVAQPVFFQKLAAAGLSPKTNEEAQQLLAIGENLLERHMQGQLKSAAAKESPIARAFEGLMAQPTGDNVEGSVKLAAAFEQQDPSLLQDAIELQKAIVQSAAA